MKDLLTTVASAIVIVFCVSVLFLSEEADPIEEEAEMLTHKNAAELNQPPFPLAKTTLYHRVQSVRVVKGVLHFVTADKEGLKDHYFLLRDKNVILVQEDAVHIPHNAIQFEDDGYHTIKVTIPTTFGLNLMHDLTCMN